MDRNLGASQVATSSDDTLAYGDLYQWGRGADGHQCQTSSTISTLSSTDQPGHGSFILSPISPNDWRSPQNPNLWQGVNGINNPCPSGYRIPTYAELNEERMSWSSNDAAGAFASPLKLPVAGFRYSHNGSLSNVGSSGDYWGSAVSGIYSSGLGFGSSNALMISFSRAGGQSVRCLRDLNTAPASIPTVMTDSIYGIAQTDAICAGNITDDGGAPLTARGFCWNNTGSPTLADSFTSDGTGTGVFTGSITGLIPNTNYYLKAYATNSEGTAYGNEVQFTTLSSSSVYPPGTIHCTATPTAIVDVTNPVTGKVWMDRNLGASQVATSSDDTLAYGDLYQWGRGADGHQCRTSLTTSTLSSTDQPAHDNFILAPNSPYDWRSPQNPNLWQGVNGINNPCPSGYRIPTYAELNEERMSWSSSNAQGAFASPLKLPVAGHRYNLNGSFYYVGSYGLYWSSAVDGSNSSYLYFGSSTANMNNNYRRAYGQSVRCLKD
jgi:uncharacterized protein (TIGR02145 family)